QEGDANVARAEAVCDHGCSRVWSVGLVDQRIGDARNGPQLDGDHVIEHPASIREAGEVASEDPEHVGVRRGRYGHVETQQVRWRWTGEILEPRDNARGEAGEQDRDQVRTWRTEASQMREDARIEDRKQTGKLWMLHKPEEPVIVPGLQPVP